MLMFWVPLGMFLLYFQSVKDIYRFMALCNVGPDNMK